MFNTYSTNDNNNFDYYTISSGDTLYKIASNYKLSPSLLARLNGLEEDDYIYPNQVLLIPKAGRIFYFTIPGDTMESISKELKINPNDLLLDNSKLYLQPDQLIVYRNK